MPNSDSKRLKSIYSWEKSYSTKFGYINRFKVACK